MATEQDVKFALDLFHQNQLHKSFNEINKSDLGTFAVIKYLYTTNGEVRSKDISEALCISSARMAILLKKLESKNLIIKQASKNDARSVVVTLSEQGRVVAKKIKKQMYNSMERIVDEFGIEELQNIFNKLNRIKTLLHETLPINTEENND